jgi:hypothetical protein
MATVVFFLVAVLMVLTLIGLLLVLFSQGELSLVTSGSQLAPRGAAPSWWHAATPGQEGPQVSGNDC